MSLLLRGGGGYVKASRKKEEEMSLKEVCETGLFVPKRWKSTQNINNVV